MLKKLAAVFAILSAVCVLAVIPLTPFAVRDLSNIVIPRYNQLKSIQPLEVFPLDENITTLSLLDDTYRLNTIRITHSETREIVVKSDSLSTAGLKVESSGQGNTLCISLRNSREPLNIFTIDYEGELWDNLIRLALDDVNVEIAIPDGLILTDPEGNNLLDGTSGDRYHPFQVDRNVQYFRIEDTIPSGEGEPVQKPVASYEARVKQLRNDLLQLVRANAGNDGTQLEFNMNFNDCRIRMEALLLEYAKENKLINYDKYKDSSASSKRTGLAAIRDPQPVDTSVDEAEAKAAIRELSGLYLSRLVEQAKLDYGRRSLDEEDIQPIQQKIDEYTNQIKNLEESHPEFVAGLMATGLLF